MSCSPVNDLYEENYQKVGMSLSVGCTYKLEICFACISSKSHFLVNHEASFEVCVRLMPGNWQLSPLEIEEDKSKYLKNN